MIYPSSFLGNRAQSRITQSRCNAQPAEDLHPSSRYVIALPFGTLAPARPQFGNKRLEPSLRQTDGERETHRPGAHDEDLRVKSALREGLSG